MSLHSGIEGKPDASARLPSASASSAPESAPGLIEIWSEEEIEEPEGGSTTRESTIRDSAAPSSTDGLDGECATMAANLKSAQK